MIKQTLSSNRSKKGDIKAFALNAKERNAAWVNRALADFKLSELSEWSFVLLTGSTDVASFRLRVAQSHFRSDMLPSYWSDCVLLQTKKNSLHSFYHIPLLQPANASFAPLRNGVVQSTLSKLPDADSMPNLALLAIPVAEQQTISALQQFQHNRAAVDALALLLPWLGFCWGTGHSSNPLLQQLPLPSAQMIQLLFSSAGFDLTPGVNTDLAAPEAFWSGIKHWQHFYSQTQQHGASLPKARYVLGHGYEIS